MKKMNAFVVMVLFLLPGFALAQINDQEKAEGFVDMFNGKDLTDWQGNPALWSVVDGCIVGQTASEGPAKLNYNQFLFWTGGDVEDFVVRADIRLSQGGNSGFQYRSWELKEPTMPYRACGYQADFDGPHVYSGILYGEGFGGILCRSGEETVVEDVDGKRVPRTVKRFAENEALKNEIKVEDWNSYEIIAQGFTFTHKINGRIVSICTDNSAEKRAGGLFAIQAHVGPPMKVEVRNLRIKRLAK